MKNNRSILLGQAKEGLDCSIKIKPCVHTEMCYTQYITL